MITEKMYLIYADDFIEWDKNIGDFKHNDSYFGFYLHAHNYARKKYGKKYVIHEFKSK